MELMELRMELPDDVLCLIREYAKPWFKYHLEYNQTIRILGLDSFPELRICLQYTPDQILPILVTFEKAHTEYLLALHEYVGEVDAWVYYSKKMKFHEKGCILRDCQYKVNHEVNRLFQMIPLGFLIQE